MPLFPELGPHESLNYGRLMLISNASRDLSMEDSIGKRFGKWLIIAHVGKNKKSEPLYECKCDCGVLKVHSYHDLKRGITTQCKSCYMKILNKTEDLCGKRFGLWLVGTKFKNIDRNEWYYNCSCSCGSVKKIAAHHLKSGATTKCHRCRVKTHGMSYTSTFKIWSGILSRCLNPNLKAYRRYGGRGIKVCDRWLKFENFLADMGERPTRLQIDRINNDSNYEPGNCRWVTPLENSRNRNISGNKRRN